MGGTIGGSGKTDGSFEMLKVHELEKAVTSLPQSDYAEFRQWFLQSDWEKWDREIEEDAAVGKLAFLSCEAVEAKKQGTLRDL
jgi:hypothetical protein